jgi:two-component system, chemotaxis family, CheB/CheR fusion protein
MGTAKRATKQPAGKPPVKRRAVQPPSRGKEPFLIVGIGASAGGLEAFRDLLEAMPVSSGMAFVFVQHLAPSHESMLSTLLAGYTRMPVHEVRNKMTVERDHVYVIPPNAGLGIRRRRLELIALEESAAKGHRAIDLFFRSLAEDVGGKAVGVLLSGTGSDGVLGLQAIKAMGGITLAQDAKSAKFDSMPRAAAAAGVADFVLPPRDIAAKLVGICNHPVLIPAPAHEAGEQEEKFAGADDELRKILGLVWARHHVDFTHYKLATVKRRIMRRMVLHRTDDLSQYLEFLQKNPEKVEALFQDLVINVTSFFRDPDAFDVLKQEVYPNLLPNKAPERPLRVWVPGCSSGEEVYSLAISLLEFLGEQGSPVPVQIFGTDISEPAIVQARSGGYPENIEADVSQQRLHRYFLQAENGYRIAKSVRDLCIFAHQNVIKDPPFSNIDLISCRNLLIYLDNEAQRRVLSTFSYALNDGGFLLLGSSESIGSLTDLFALAHKKHKIYRKKTVLRRPTVDFALREWGQEHRPAARQAVERFSIKPDLQKAAEKVLLEKYAPPGVLVNGDMDILQFRGRTGIYLEPAPGAASFNLLKMARESLLVPLRAVIQEAREGGAVVRRERIAFRADNQTRKVGIEVIPVPAFPQSEERGYWVLFDDASPETAAGQAGRKVEAGRPGKKEKEAEQDEVSMLRQELAATKEYLQSIIEGHEALNEEVRSASEELLSGNEELQSTNEELETAKEELQSTNEELTTLNDELRARNQDLSQVNDDLSNLLAGVQLAIVMLDGDLRIRRFTPAAEKLMNLIPTDLGRPLSDMKLKLSVPDLDALIRRVMDTLESRDMEVQDPEGHWYRLRIRPYRTMENKINGAVLSLSGIDEFKSSAGKNERYLRYAEAAMEVTHDPVLVLDRDLRVIASNPAFQARFRLSPADMAGRSVYELDKGRWTLPRLRELLEKELAAKSEHGTFVVEHGQVDGQPKRLKVNIQRLPDGEGSDPAILLAFAEADDHGD